MNTDHPMWNRALVAVSAIAIVLSAGVSIQASAGTQLWLYPDSDDPRNGGHVVDGGTFVLNIENRGGGNGDNTVSDVFLVLAVQDSALLTGGSLVFPDGSTAVLDDTVLAYQTPVLQCSGRTFPPHGVYPAYIVEFPIGEILQGQVVQVAVDIQAEDGFVAHFDAHGIGYKQAGLTLKCYDVSNPSGHGVTVLFGGEEEDECYDLRIDKVATASGADIGDEIDYLISVENNGTCDLTGVVITEDIPTVTTVDGDEVPAFTVVAMDPSPTDQTGETLIWAIGDLLVGESSAMVITVVFDEPAADGSIVVNTVCVVAEEIEDEICASAMVEVGDFAGRHIGGPGFWCNQIRFAIEGRHNARFTLEELEAWLVEINETSLVFPELWDTELLESVQDLLCRPSQAETVADRLS
ncbi:MAG: DUF11 domain-containing protein, partial [Thermoanaerobaculales bacterium]|nr:DUF11 domain-containing protein [Thermoanaerobaculales bacterium]